MALSPAKARGRNARPEANPVVIARPGGHRPYKVVFAPLQRPIGASAPPIGSAAVATIYRRWRTSYKSFPATLRETYGLTRAETRVCQALLNGRSLPEVSAYLAISRNTAKTHLGRIFDKTSVRSQAALLRLLAFSARGSQVTNCLRFPPPAVQVPTARLALLTNEMTPFPPASLAKTG
ncbi:MAG: helix-turn-helix transcriptional regulator [Gammaproteobacteria bacterium]